MEQAGSRLCTAFVGMRCVASGKLADVALRVKEVLERGEQSPVLIFDERTSERIEVDFRGTPQDVGQRLTTPVGASVVQPDEAEAARGPGRPKLGVVAREVTLLPRHWEWLNSQPGGASVALRRLVEEARRANEGKDRARRAQEAAYRFMSTMAGDLPGFEEASRSLFSKDRERLKELVREWPEDVRSHLLRLVAEYLRLDAEAGTGTGGVSS